MKQKISAGLIYLAAAYFLWVFLNAVDGANEPSDIPHYGLLKAAACGVVALVAAAVLSVFSLRFGAICGVCGCSLVWLYLSLYFPWFPPGYWGRVPVTWSWDIEYNLLGLSANIYLSLAATILATIQSLRRIRRAP